MIGQILSAIAAIPRIIDGITAIFRFIEANKSERWFQESARVFGEIRNAESDEDRRRLANELRDLIRRL